MPNSRMIVVNGWRLYAHRLLLDEVERLLTEVESLQIKSPDNYKEKNNCKRLTAIFKLIIKDLPNNPASLTYRQGNTLGKNNKHWFKEKFFQQYRLFLDIIKLKKLLYMLG